MHTSHGHHIPGTDRDIWLGGVARCGGPGLCMSCSTEAAFAIKSQNHKEEKMEFTEFVRKPFVVEAVEITADNIAEVAELVGTLKEKDDGTPFIQVDRRLIPNIYRVYPGFWMTRMGDNIRCYSKRIFTEQFVKSNPSLIGWVNTLNDNSPVEVSNEPCNCDACEGRKAHNASA